MHAIVAAPAYMPSMSHRQLVTPTLRRFQNNNNNNKCKRVSTATFCHQNYPVVLLSSREGLYSRRVNPLLLAVSVSSRSDVGKGLRDDRGNARAALNIAGRGCRSLSHHRCAAGAGVVRLRSGKITRAARNKNATARKTGRRRTTLRTYLAGFASNRNVEIEPKNI